MRDSKNQSGSILENQPLAPLTTWKIGGMAGSGGRGGVEDVYRLMALAQDRGWPLWFLGRGSNILIDDAGLPGITLHLAKSLQRLERRRHLRAGAGVSLPRLARAAAGSVLPASNFWRASPAPWARRCASTPGPTARTWPGC